MADLMVIPLGKDARLFYGVAGTSPLVLSLEVTGVTDLTVTLEKDEAEVTRRSSGGWEDHREGIKRLSLSFNLMGTTVSANSEVTVFGILRACFISGAYGGNTGIALHACSSLSPGAGPEADFIITRFERAENLGDAQIYAVECRMHQIMNRSPAVAWAAAPVV